MKPPLLPSTTNLNVAITDLLHVFCSIRYTVYDVLTVEGVRDPAKTARCLAMQRPGAGWPRSTDTSRNDSDQDVPNGGS